MTKVLDIDEAQGRLLVRFDFHPRIKDEVKALGARWDWEARVWHFPLADAAQVVGRLEAMGFVAMPELAAHVDQGEPERAQWTVGMLHGAATRAITQQFPQAIWLVAEVANLRQHRGGPHRYFALVERDEAGRVVATVDAVLFRGARERVEARLAEAGVALEDELAVCVRGRPTIYAARGSFQFVIEDVDPRFSLGALERRREEVLAALRAEDLLERNLERPLPVLPLRIALLTSAGSEAEADFLETLRASGWPFVVTRFDVRVQGEGLAPSVCGALSSLREEDFDLVVITRGGGSRVELASWDDLAVARAVATLPLPVLVAIGHENDRSVLDAIARSAKTPTAAGSWLVDALDAAEEEFRVHADRLLQVARDRVTREQGRVREAAMRARHQVALRLQVAQQEVERVLPARLARASRDALGRAQSRVEEQARRTRRGALRGPLRAESLRLARQARLLASVARAPLARERQRLDGLSEQVRLADPRRLLERGYVMMRGPSGEILGDASALQVGEAIRLETRDARLRARIEAIEARPTPSARESKEE